MQQPTSNLVYIISSPVVRNNCFQNWGSDNIFKKFKNFFSHLTKHIYKFYIRIKFKQIDIDRKNSMIKY